MLNEKIIYYRKKNGLSQEDLAGKLLVSRQTVSQWETGQTLPTVDNLIRLHEIFGVTMDELISDEAPAEEETPAQEAAAANPGERFSFVLSREELERGTKGLWGRRNMIAVAAAFVIPVFLFANLEWDLVKDALPVLAFILAAIMIGSFFWLNNRKKKWLNRNDACSEKTEIRADAEAITQTVQRDCETVRLLKMAYEDIAYVEDLKTVFRVVDHLGRMMILPKRTMDPEGALLRWLGEQGETCKRKKYGKRSILTVVCAGLVLLAVAVISMHVFSSFKSVDEMSKYAWILPAAGLLVSLGLLVRGIVCARKKRRLAVLQIISGSLFCFWCVGFVLMSVLLPRMQGRLEQSVTEIESQIGIDLPDNAEIGESNYASIKTNNVRVSKITVLTMDRSTSLAFDNEVAAEPKWIRGKLAFPLNPLWSPVAAADTAQYVMLVNLTTGQFNELPKENGTYTCLNVLYRQEEEKIYIIKYEIDYRRK